MNIAVISKAINVYKLFPAKTEEEAFELALGFIAEYEKKHGTQDWVVKFL